MRFCALLLLLTFGLANGFDAQESDRSLAAKDSSWEAVTEKVCEGKETQTSSCISQLPCSPCMPWDCAFAAWTEWVSSALVPCSGLCERFRSINQTGTECGRHCKGVTRQTKACPDPSCIGAANGCKFSVWSNWSTCGSSSEQSTRKRKILSEAGQNGSSCSGNLVETVACSGNQPKNCSLSQWSGWSRCSASCGGGSSTRIRRVAQHADKHGKTCTGSLSQEIVCNPKRCPVYKDCVLGAWDAWSPCRLTSSEMVETTGPSYGQRTRARSITNSAGGGRRCASATKETKGCVLYLKLPMDCVLSSWSAWGACSEDCGGGQKNRSRIVVTAPAHGGTCPAGTTREIAGCNTQRCHHGDCRLGQWEPWTPCPVTCGTGFISRFRAVTEASPGGRPCAASSLTEVKPCDVAECKKKDCVWSSWSLWSECSKSCGGGVTERYRNLTSLPQNGGTCQPVLRRVAMACKTEPCPANCVNGAWGAWTRWTPCSVTCGRGYMMRKRTMARAPDDCGFPALGIKDEFASCTQMSKECHVEPDIDCQLSAWTPWSDCSGSCSGVMSRKRTVKVYAHGHGQACDDAPLKQIKQCSKNSEFQCSGKHISDKAACNMTEWTSFGPCSVSCGGGTIIRTRSIIPPHNGGSSCKGSLSKVEPCGTTLCPSSQCVNCIWGKWSEWDACVNPEGQRSRRREIQQIGNYCGKRCEDTSAVETDTCRTSAVGPAYVFCTWTDWTPYSACPASCGANPITRERSLEKSTGRSLSYLVRARIGDALTCSGKQEDMSFCQNNPCTKCTPQDCKLSSWSEWEAGAGTGLCKRIRSVAAFNNECGKGCSGILSETKGCPVPVLRVDCAIADWSMWTGCSRDYGQRERNRYVEKAPANGGKACSGSLKETRSCNASWLPAQDCETSAWSSWSTCTAECNTGSQERMRNVITLARWPGKPCDLALQQLRDCNTVPCGAGQNTKQDCKFTEWGAWSSTCSAQNQRLRERHIKSGASCGGAVQQTQECTSGKVDCNIAEWTAWSICDTTCGVGRRERTRQIHEYPQMGGKACPVDLVELGICNENRPCDAQEDCQVSSWMPWTPCTATCGVGQSMRSRKVIKNRTLAGAACHMTMSETRPCRNEKSCITQCVWGKWSKWGDCSRSCGGGMKTRNRGITRAPSAGAETCSAKSEEQVAKCNSVACKLCSDGAWALWSQWSPCSSSCEDGFTWRMRKVAKEASKCGVPAYGDSQEVKACGSSVPCVRPSDCVFGSWGDWGACSATADGVHERERYIAKYSVGTGAQCKGALKQVRPCQVSTSADKKSSNIARPQPCVFSVWTAFSSCSASCGSGQQSRSRYIVQDNSTTCQGPLNQTRSCNTKLCRRSVDCAWHDWSPWGKCDVCSGIRHRDRHIKTPGLYGGVLCHPSFAHEVGKCPRDCQGKYLCTWASWSTWSACSKTCGSNGSRTRTRELHPVNSSADAGVENLNENLEDKVAELYRRNQHAEAQRLQHVAMAFLSGVVTLIVVLAAVRPRDREGRSNRELQIYCVGDRRLAFL